MAGGAVEMIANGFAGRAGIGLRDVHADEIIATRPPVGWLEVHPENYLGGGPRARVLRTIWRDYPVSLHGVGLSLGSADGLDARHLARVAGLVRAIDPVLVSEHLSWSIAGGAHLNHLLPLPYTEESLAVLCDTVDRAQEVLGRALLIENPSSYLRFRHSPIPEPEFLGALAARSGCGLLHDVNNAFVTCRNFGQDPAAYLAALRPEAIGEIHLAGHASNDVDGRVLTIQLFVYPQAWSEHLVWGSILLFLLTRGAGAISLDHLISRRFDS